MKKCSKCKCHRQYPEQFTRKSRIYKTCNMCSNKTGSINLNKTLKEYFENLNTTDTQLLSLKHRFNILQNEYHNICQDLVNAFNQ